MPRINNGTFLAGLGIAGFAGLVAGGLVGGIIGYKVGQSPSTAESRADTGTGSKQVAGGTTRSQPIKLSSGVVSRRDFEAAIIGKTRDVVIATIGRPDETEEGVPVGTYNAGPKEMPMRMTFVADWWIYRGRVMNEATGKPYATARVRLLGNSVDRFEYR